MAVKCRFYPAQGGIPHDVHIDMTADVNAIACAIGVGSSMWVEKVAIGSIDKGVYSVRVYLYMDEFARIRQQRPPVNPHANSPDGDPVLGDALLAVAFHGDDGDGPWQHVDYDKLFEPQTADTFAMDGHVERIVMKSILEDVKRLPK